MDICWASVGIRDKILHIDRCGYCMISFNLSVMHHSDYLTCRKSVCVMRHVGYLTKGSKMSWKRGKNAERILCGLYDLATELQYVPVDEVQMLMNPLSHMQPLCIFIIECPAKSVLLPTLRYLSNTIVLILIENEF